MWPSRSRGHSDVGGVVPEGAGQARGGQDSGPSKGRDTGAAGTRVALRAGPREWPLSDL